MRVRLARRHLNGGGVDFRQAETDVVEHRAREQKWLLRNNAGLSTQRLLGHSSHINIVDAHCAFAHVVEARHQIGDCRLARARRPDQSHSLPRLDHETNVAQDRHIAAVRKVDPAQLDLPGDRRHLFAALRIRHVGPRVQQLQHSLTAGHGRLHGRVELAQLLHRLEEAGHIGKKRHQHAQLQRALRDGPPAEPKDNSRRQYRQKFDRRQKDERKRHRIHECAAIVLIGRIEAVAHRLFLRERLDHSHPGQVLRQRADNAGHAAARLAKRDPCSPREPIRRQQHQRKYAECEQRQRRAERQHDTDDAEQNQQIADQADQPLRQQFVDDRNITDHARNRYADDMPVVVPQRERLQVAHQLHPQRRQYTLTDPR